MAWHGDGDGMGWMLMVIFFPRQNILGNLGSCWFFLFSLSCFFNKEHGKMIGGFKKGHIWKEQERKHLYLLTYGSQV